MTAWWRFLRGPIAGPTIIVMLASSFLFGPVFRGEVPLPVRSIGGLTWGQPEALPQGSIFRDRIVQAYPYHVFAATEIQAGRLPLWNNLIFSGTPFFANGQAGILSLTKLPWWWLPPWLGYIAATLAQSVLAGFGMALLGRKLGWKPAASTIAGLALVLSSSFVMRLTVTTMSAVFAWLPIVLWAILRLHETLTWRRAAVAAMLIAGMVFSGHVQLAALALVFAGAWTLAWWRKPQFWRRAMSVTVAFCLGIGITAVQLLPVKEALGEAYRQPTHQSWSKLLKPSNLFRINKKNTAALATTVDQNIWGNEAHYRGPANYLEGNLFLGALAMMFVLCSVRAWRKRGWMFVAIFGAVTAGLFVFPGWWGVVGKIAPWITVTPVWRTSFLLTFCLALLAGYGAQFLLAKRRDWLGWGAAGLVAVTALWQWWGILPFAPKTQLFPPDTLLSVAKTLTADGSRLWTPNGVLDQFMPYGIATVEGYDSVYPKSYLELFQANSEIRKRNQLHVKDPNDHVLAATGGTTMITSEAVPAGWTMIMQSGRWTLAKKVEAVPPIHAVERFVTEGATPSLSAIDASKEALIVGDAPGTEPLSDTTIQVTRRTASALSMRTTSKNGAAIVTNMQWYPGWRLRIDGNDARAAMIKVNHSFIGLSVPAGNHAIYLRYQPRSLMTGLYISLGALAAVLWLCFKHNTRPNHGAARGQ